MNSNQNYPNPRMDLIPLLMENQSPKDPATKTILKIVKIVTQKRFFFLNHAKKNSEMIGLIPRSLNTRKKASGLFCIPPNPSHGSEIPWRIPHLSLHPSLAKPQYPSY